MHYEWQSTSLAGLSHHNAHLSVFGQYRAYSVLAKNFEIRLCVLAFESFTCEHAQRFVSRDCWPGEDRPFSYGWTPAMDQYDISRKIINVVANKRFRT
jgi:hypothetical protein